MIRPSEHKGLIGIAAAALVVVAASLVLRAGSHNREGKAPNAARSQATAPDGRADAQSHGAQILPSEPYGFSELSVRLDAALEVSAAAAGGSAAAASGLTQSDTSLRTIWSINGQDVGDGPTLSPHSFARGDEVRVRAERRVNGGPSQVVAWASTRIHNAPPLLQRVEVHPVAGQPDQIEAVVEAADPDNDPVTLTYAWAVGGQPVDGATDPRFSVAQLARGQSVSVSVIANDGQDDSRGSQATWSQDNHPPVIAPASAASVTRDQGGMAHIACPLQISDPDGDAVTVELVDAPAGVSWDAASGSVSWAPEADLRQIAVTVRARDDKGGESQRTLQLSF